MSKSMWVASTPPCVATTSVEYVQWGRLCSNSLHRSHGVEHGIIDLCQGQPPGPSSDGGTNEAICVEEGQLLV